MSVSHPEAMVPTMSKIPTSASSPAAVVCDMPWSCAEGMKWMPMSPLVVAPQIAKASASAQKAWCRTANRSPSIARPMAPPVTSAGGTQVCGSAPKGRTPRSCGWSRMTSQAMGATASAATAMTREAGRQPTSCARAATGGRKISCPVAEPAVRTPMTSPLRATNHRLATVAARTRAIDPVPVPMSTPQKMCSCQDAVISVLPPAPSATRVSAPAMICRMPKRSIRAAAKGATSP